MKAKLFLIPLMASMMLITSCKKDPAAGKNKIKFWGWGDETEIEVFKDLVKKYNDENQENIYVEYTVKPSDSYVSTMDKILSQNKTPDIFYVGDGDIKRWATYDYLEDLTPYIEQSKIIDLDDIWEEGLNRYRYNPQTKKSGLEAGKIFCLPKDIGPTVIYYNVDAFTKAGINIISIPEKDCTPEQKHGFNKALMTFNNRISMTVEEELELAKLLTKSINPSSPTKYGYYTEWWFNYVWSVGGDCLGKNENGDYIWTLGDTTPHKTVINDVEVPLPSNRELFEHFVNLSVVEKVMPNPSTVSSARKATYFRNQNVAMLVGLRAHVPAFRKGCNFNWDVAPLSHAENGHLAGHSGSMGFGISKKISQDKKDASFKFMEYLAGPEGQTKTAESGFNLPNQISVSKTEAFLQTDQKPKNSIIFVEAAEYQTEGDWAYLVDNKWIDIWSGTLNGDVLDGKMTIDEFFAKFQAATDEYLKNNY